MSTENNAVSIEAELDAAFGAYVSADQSPGLAYGIVTAEGLTHSAGFGRANHLGTAPNADTPFPIASMSKSFIAAAVLIARDRGLLSLDDPITKFLPDFRANGAPEDPCDPPSIRMLLSMSGGLTEDNSWVDPQIGMSEAELMRLVAKGLKYSHTPGTVYEYSNVGFTLTGFVVAKVTGMSIQDFVTNEIFTPLGMTSTSFSPSSHDPAILASAHSLDADGNWRPYGIRESDSFAAAGGIVSTVRDLSVWVTWLGEAFRPGKSLGIDVLSRASRREMQRIESLIPPSIGLQPSGTWKVDISGYALGLFVNHDLHRGVTVEHSGGLPGYVLHMCWHPETGLGLVMLTNSHRGRPVALARECHARLLRAHDAPSETIVLWKETVAARLAAEQLIRSWSDDNADELFAENVDFDRPLADRRAEIDAFVAEIGPLGDPRPLHEVLSAATAADVTWSIPGERGELICMVHLNELDPPRVQEFVLKAVPSDKPRSATPFDISPRRAALGEASLSAAPNARVIVPSL
ncbi:MAG TPA: serine hydrolase domain-containing protein [Acidimicrobiales bacterium]|jgi:CubicO group peptidase (beta-lactamase class C family)|nr:serine hydrolase domain-containing protein [Acidimicrobiales bacterium]